MTYDRSTHAVYQAAGFGGQVPRGGRPAVIVVDLTRGFTQPEFATGTDLTVQVEQTNRVIGAARQARRPVIFTAISYTRAEVHADSVTWFAKAKGLRSLIEGSAAVDLDPRLDRHADDIIVLKKGASAFFGTGLAAILVALATDTVVVCGATTSGCLRASVVDAVQSGFPVLVPEECAGDRAAAPHEASLFDIREKYGDVVTVDETLDYLSSLTAAPVGT